MVRPVRVLKFGGTSVANASHWDGIASRVRTIGGSHRVWIVVSALARVSNAIEEALSQALSDRSLDAYSRVEQIHRDLAREGELGPEEVAPVEALLADTRRVLEGVRLTGEAPPRLRARVMAVGELASSALGVALLARRHVDARLVDARDLLVSEVRPGEPPERRYLDARVAPRRDAAAAELASGGAEIVLTQGFIARTSHGETCLLGRGGSDTSAALLAALLEADELEIWTDVHGLFTADPRRIPTARLLRRIGYREAEELASMGAKVLHPRCLEPVAWAGIPLSVRCTDDPSGEGTRVEADDERHPTVTAVACRNDVVLLTVQTLAMWGSSGFLARVFAPFDELGVSVDLVATSQSAVSVTLDRIPGGLDGERFQTLLARLAPMGEVKVVHPCAVVSIVGRRIRTVLHELAPALDAFQDRPVHLLSQSSEDLNLSFVVDESDAPPLLAKLHDHLIPSAGGDERLGPTWQALRRPTEPRPERPSWWRGKRQDLLRLGADGRARYVYDLTTVAEAASRLRRLLPSVDAFYYAMKANPHRAILETVRRAGFGVECVSAAEIHRVREVLGPDAAILFTPNFCPIEEYEIGFDAGAEITIDGPHALARAPGLFRDREVALRLDPGRGLGHHEKVRTAGAQAKFGHPIDEIDGFLEEALRLGVRVMGLHAHVGSGILDAASWARTGSALAAVVGSFPDLRWIDLGGGLGVVERPDQAPLDLAAMEAGLASLKGILGGIALRLEPGRFVVSEAGVLIAPVTQVRSKGPVRFVGVATGMNSLLPARPLRLVAPDPQSHPARRGALRVRERRRADLRIGRRVRTGPPTCPRPGRATSCSSRTWARTEPRWRPVTTCGSRPRRWRSRRTDRPCDPIEPGRGSARSLPDESVDASPILVGQVQELHSGADLRHPVSDLRTWTRISVSGIRNADSTTEPSRDGLIVSTKAPFAPRSLRRLPRLRVPSTDASVT